MTGCLVKSVSDSSSSVPLLFLTHVLSQLMQDSKQFMIILLKEAQFCQNFFTMYFFFPKMGFTTIYKWCQFSEKNGKL